MLDICCIILNHHVAMLIPLLCDVWLYCKWHKLPSCPLAIVAISTLLEYHRLSKPFGFIIVLGIILQVKKVFLLMMFSIKNNYFNNDF